MWRDKEWSIKSNHKVGIADCTSHRCSVEEFLQFIFDISNLVVITSSSESKISGRALGER